MKKLIFTLLFSLFAIVFNVYAQSISGSITDSEDGLPLAGVNIVVQGENRGAVSDFDGNFTITNFESGSTILQNGVIFPILLCISNSSKAASDKILIEIPVTTGQVISAL